MPAEFNIYGVYLSPSLVVAALSLLAAVVSAHLLNRFRLSRFFVYPPVVFLSLVVIYAGLFGTFVIPV